MHILMTSGAVLVDAHFIFSGFFSLTSLSSLFPFFLDFWIFKTCNTAGCLPLQTLQILYWNNFLHCVLWKYCRGIHSITSSYIVSLTHKYLTLFNMIMVTTSWKLCPIFLSTFSCLAYGRVCNLCFVDLLCCFNGFFSYWPTASLKKKWIVNKDHLIRNEVC